MKIEQSLQNKHKKPYKLAWTCSSCNTDNKFIIESKSGCYSANCSKCNKGYLLKDRDYDCNVCNNRIDCLVAEEQYEGSFDYEEVSDDELNNIENEKIANIILGVILSLSNKRIKKEAKAKGIEVIEGKKHTILYRNGKFITTVPRGKINKYTFQGICDRIK